MLRERVIYIFGIMFNYPYLITGVLILKAFFAWTEKSAEPPSGTTATAPNQQGMFAVIAHYHTYVVGNLLSVLTGLFFAMLGLYLFPLFFARAVKLFLSSP